MNIEEDTDVLLALLTSLLEDDRFTQSELLGALADSNGNIEAAASALRERSSEAKVTGASRDKTKKRKRTNGLDSWLGVKKNKPNSTQLSPPDKKIPQDKDITERNGKHPVYEVVDDSDSDEAGIEGPSTPNKPKSRVVHVTSLMDVLKQAPSTIKKPMQLPPRTLGTPELIAEHTPCTLHYSILPPELASRLFYMMLNEASDWDRNRWWLFDRMVESPHKTSFYARETDGVGGTTDWQEAAQFWYNGRPTPPPRKFLPEMEAACRIIEDAVNAEIRKRQRYSQEWPSDEYNPWRANVAASNCYTGVKEGVGFHSDQLTYLGPFPTIASLSLGTTRTFRLREVVPDTEKSERTPQTFNMPLIHNSLCIMHASCQERFKHTVPIQNTIDAFKPPFPPPKEFIDSNGNLHPSIPSPNSSRINITFRFYRPDFKPSSIPRCNCDLPTVLRPSMKKRVAPSGKDTNELGIKHFWMCYAGAQNEGKGCTFYKDLDMKQEGRGNFSNSLMST